LRRSSPRREVEDEKPVSYVVISEDLTSTYAMQERTEESANFGSSVNNFARSGTSEQNSSVEAVGGLLTHERRVS
jgi:hypothetical protein